METILSIAIRLGNRVIPTPTPRMTTQQTLDGEPTSFDWAILLQRLDGILRARWGKTARRWRIGRYAVLVELHQGKKRPRGNPLTSARQLVPKSSALHFR